MTLPEPAAVWRGVAAPARAELRERASRFVASLAPAADSAAADAFAAAVARELFDATHHARAQRILEPDADEPLEFAADGGEPAGTAGRPILRALGGAGLVNVVLIVSRWFGGTKLGRGGLARAYGAAARASIAQASLGRVRRLRRLDVRADYADAGALSAAVSRLGARIERVSPAEEYSATLLVADERSADLAGALAEATGGRARVASGGRLLALEPAGRAAD
jgi:putative IMPACT (imprinted ancient) family translation regulator